MAFVSYAEMMMMMLMMRMMIMMRMMQSEMRVWTTSLLLYNDANAVDVHHHYLLRYVSHKDRISKHAITQACTAQYNTHTVTSFPTPQ